jgi:glutamate synthase (NADPH) small chain
LTTAIGHGWKAAEGIDAYLDGRQPAARPTVDAHTFQVASVNTEGSTGRDFSARTIHNLEDRSALDTQSVDKLFLGHFARSPNMRRGLKQLGPDGIVGNFEERLVPLEEEQIVAEAERCMSCGLCFECDNCAVYCPKSAVLRVKPERRSMGRYVVTDYSRCVGCHICADVCPTGYIEMAATP